ncbi:MAG: DUF998 domain-containing protein [Stackebrandtia sp.]
MSTTTTPTAVAAPPPPQGPRRGNLLWTGIVAGPLFLAVALLAGAVRSDGYDPLRHPVSSLGIGPHGWIQIANFLVAGVLTLVFAFSLRAHLKASGRGSLLGPLFLGVWAVGLMGAGIFVGDPISGYPAGTPDTGIHTWHGQFHDVPFSTAGFLSMLATFLVFGRRFSSRRHYGWASYSGLTAIGFTIGLVMSTTGFEQGELVAVAGLLQRATVAIGLIWLTALAVHMRRTSLAG